MLELYSGNLSDKSIMSEIIPVGVDANFAKYMMGADLTLEEKDIVTTIVAVKANQEVDVIVPSDISNDDLVAQTSAICKVYARFLQAGVKCRPVMGRFFAVIKERTEKDPEFINTYFQCDSFSRFMNWFVPTRFRISISEAWASLKLAKDYPGITSEEYEQRGMQTKLKLIAKAVPLEGGQLTAGVNRIRQELINDSKSINSAEEMAAHIEKKGYCDAESLLSAKIRIVCSRRVRELWDDLLDDYRVKAYYGQDYLIPAKIFEDMIAEYTTAIYNAISLAKEM